MLNRITVQLPVEGLLFWKLSGREALSEPFMFTLTLLGTDARADRSALLGQPVTVTIPTQALMTPRYLNGKVTRVAVSAVELSGTRYAAYELTVEPDLWPMQRDRNLRIFQGQTVPQIVKTLLGESRVNMEERLSGSYRVWEYCVQYQESSLDFISRLLELEGIAYHFRHEQDRHTLVLTDAPGQYEPFPGYETIPYHVTPSGGSTDEEGISQWALEDSVTPGIYSLDDYDFRKPNAWLFQARQNPLSPQPGSIDVYDWPGRFVEHGHGEFYARIRQERWQVEHRQTQGTATALGIAPGHTFVLRNAPFFGDNGEYLTTIAHYRFEENRYASGPDSNTLHEIRFEVIPADVPYRPAQKTPWPRTYGPQTAKVVGPQGESIWTDKYGRVKVKFHWDRLGKGDDTSSSWVRVSSAWAGQGFGGVQIPRVGDEVVVDFINGDPDRPLITGRVYNEASMPPWALPAAATQMGFLSRSKDGSPDNANALRFEDKAGEEQVWLHAEKNMDTEIENDETHSVGSNRTKTIGANETTTVKKNRTETVVVNETITVHQNRTETVDGNETITIHSNRTETVDQNEDVRIGQNQSVTVNGAQTLRVDKTKTETIALASMLNVGLAQNTNIGAAYVLNVGAGWMTNVGAMQMHNVALKYSVNSGKDLSLSAGTTADFSAEDKITLVCGESMIVLEQNGTITLSANKIKMVGEKVIDIDGTEININ
ncbi:type VI secretion system tip protein VgrG [Cronobacter sakazakii]|uniref:type VI secretion system Vgr family protein n=1 Tax=Cronobacter sakazakii TaxID=28141 RepID=UPI001BCEAD73|nr:type VI secretion system tip protein TssI/VgrG [Cronobacter sakazakii]MBS4467535.1 type VI secretion system tip protein VgrG [Cronobacter sakazakii]MBS4471900.1 type VI secretion system tip protein VgrG [Cronobacter sakazakii]MBS4476706.1 type VI secretion system tip protein VgrG [Cronobacter sakazakii]MBS4481387.1 type VI secretion system tip protein VgrG [Cronobacter sakazakii]MBS4485739.1 type VI secretion system tip protein VgrG [Cronobacter sakazakii]